MQGSPETAVGFVVAVGWWPNGEVSILLESPAARWLRHKTDQRPRRHDREGNIQKLVGGQEPKQFVKNCKKHKAQHQSRSRFFKLLPPQSVEKRC
jgi:hypothetical protein